DVLRALKEYSDESHPVSKAELLEYIETTDNPLTLSGTVDEILLRINPAEYTGENDSDYRIKYEGYDRPYDDNPLVIKSQIDEIKKEMRRKGADTEALKKELKDFMVCHRTNKAPAIKGLRYIHDFDHDDMDKLISAVALSASIAPADKERLIGKIMATASRYYKNPFYDRVRGRLKFNPYSEYSRLYSRTGETEKRIGENVKILQDAIRLRTKVRFFFDHYSADKQYVQGDKEQTLTPYYIVIYNDNYYVIGAWDKGGHAAHYRIDLMSSVTILKDKNGIPVPMRPMSECKDLPSRDLAWDPGKYMSEHLYMAFETDSEKPRKISIRIPTDKVNRYTILHDWFGDHFEINKTATKKCEEGYEVVDVVTSPTMLVHWAMQYADFCEVLDKGVREKINMTIARVNKKYKRSLGYEDK
ncbi:MAG: WYL domain-containing protein, partial [Lachnospiraceae bacterium]|nr:WYL domain-containing protein [Lachnospiraceae bacterium]